MKSTQHCGFRGTQAQAMLVTAAVEKAVSYEVAEIMSGRGEDDADTICYKVDGTDGAVVRATQTMVNQAAGQVDVTTRNSVWDAVRLKRRLWSS